jgi:hypothetical protein
MAVLVAEQAHALCFFSCTPSEANARAVFENLLKDGFKGSPYNIISFAKTNGTEREIYGQKVYELSFKAVVEFPNGANLDCKQSQDFSFKNFDEVRKCVANNRQYSPPGSKIDFSNTFIFKKTERGWKGQDGALY